ncbi:MAG: transcriptional regulator, HxlR family [Nocardia sp.]|uniref:winged helix-turn-helix transcriptional regulator n=1 Tax=Nocardia sp. TaxID=1821 RepID=UPI002608DAE9|nr:winged helix-turn-helix transcriptional regulator [Nocardia sp.]MCU1644099.1 transcriptional regulator, HxlR family [Nocardia sp.]
MAVERTSPTPPCSIAGALDLLGERWTLLVVRDASRGATRFSDFAERLGLPPDVLTDRLRKLVHAGILEKRPYREPGRRARDSYHLTAAGNELIPLLIALMHWGDSQVNDPDRPPVIATDSATGKILRLALVDEDGRETQSSDVEFRAGPGVSIAPDARDANVVLATTRARDIIAVMPKQVEVAEQRRMIAAAAVAVIGSAGIDGARLRDVAAAANVTTGAVTHYFDGKDAVLEAALEEVVRRVLDRPAPSATTPIDVRGCIDLFSIYLPLDADGLGEWRVWLAFWGRAMTDERLRAVHRRYYADIIDRISGRLSTIRTATPASRIALTTCADSVLAAIDGVGSRAVLESDSWPADRQRKALSMLLLPMLTAFADGSEEF